MLKNRYIVENLWGEVVTQPSGLFFSFEELIWRWERRTILLFVWHINFHPLRIILKFYEKYGNGLIWCLFFFFFHVVVVQGRYLGLEKYLFDSRDSFTFHSGFVWLWSSGILFISTKKGRNKKHEIVVKSWKSRKLHLGRLSLIRITVQNECCFWCNI